MLRWLSCVVPYSMGDKQVYNRETVSSITWKIFECFVKSCYRNMFKIRNVSSISENFEKKL